MRFFPTVFVALAATTTTVNANILHQHKQRALVDVCANVNADLKLLGIVFGKINLCLCASAIPTLLTTNLVVKAAILLAGKAAVVAALNGLINAAPDHHQCNYPAHAVPLCSSSNPCDFTCADGFTPSPSGSHPTQCVCQSPHTVCNGVCGNFPSCSSQRVKRDADWRDATCPHGWSACGILGAVKLEYECVDVRRDLWSCGGCDLPLLPTDPIGIDCTAIPGAHDVECLSGRCVVRRCKDDFTISADKATCLPMTRMSPNRLVFVHKEAGPYKT